MNELLTLEARLFVESCEVEILEGAEVPAASPIEHLDAMNGRLKLDVPHVRGEHKVPMRGTVPENWSVL